jgi:hypothetical protein
MTLFNKISQLMLATAMIGATTLAVAPKAQAEEWGPSQVTAYSAEDYPGTVASGRGTTWQLLDQGGLYVAEKVCHSVLVCARMALAILVLSLTVSAIALM